MSIDYTQSNIQNIILFVNIFIILNGLETLMEICTNYVILQNLQ